MRKLQVKVIQAVFYRNSTGTEPVHDWLMEMQAADRKIIGTDIRTVEMGWPIGMPVCRPMGDGLYEVRSNIINGIARVLFCAHDGKMVLLHGFVKKSQKTPDGDLALARKRKKEVER